MPQTSTLTVNDAGNPETISASVVCRKITIGEDPSVANWPTGDYNVRKPLITDTPRRRTTGSTYVFERPDGSYFDPGDVAGFVDFVSGSTTFFIDEV